MPYKESYGLLMKKDSHLSKKKYITKEDLLNIPIICPKRFFNNKSKSNKFYEWIGEDIDKLNIVLTYNLIYNAAIMVEEGIGYVITMDKLINTVSESDLCFIPLKPKLYVTSSIIWKKNQVFSKASKIFLDKVKEKLGS